MGFFPEAVAAQLGGRTVHPAVLAAFDFASNPMRVHLGSGKLRAGGHVYEGIGRFGSISGLEQAIGGTAPVATFTLSGVDTALVASVRNSSDEVKGRDVTVLVQFYDEGYAPLDAPLVVYAGEMDLAKIQLTGPTKASVSVTVETVFTRHGLPMWGTLSNADQNRLYPGDRGLEMVAQIPFKTAIWPIIKQTTK